MKRIFLATALSLLRKFCIRSSAVLKVTGTLTNGSGVHA